MISRFWVITLIVLGFIGCTVESTPELISVDMALMQLVERSAKEASGPDAGIEFYSLPQESDLSEIPQDSKNPLTPEKVMLGKMLFFETGFATKARNPSGMGTYSCGTCHIPSAGFKSGTFQGIADGGEAYGLNGEDRRRHPDYITPDLDVQNARPLSLLNVAYVKNTTWNGRFGREGVNEGTSQNWVASDGTDKNALGFKAIETQNFKGLETHRIEMNKELIDQFGYTALFDASFPDLTPEERYSNFGGSLAISAYIRTLITNQAPFQTWLSSWTGNGDRNALSLDEKKGAILFFDKALCSNCHYNQNLGSMEFHALGVKDMDRYQTSEAERLDRNLGRGAFTGLEEDMRKFKVPGLYNISDSPFYFHGASIKDLDELIEYKNQAVSENPEIPQERLSEKFLPLNLTEEEKQQLTLFLTKSLRDPGLERYAPQEIMSQLCFPNNDLVSRIDLGCN